MAGDSPSESVASQVRAARKLSPDGTKAIYDLTSSVDFSKPKRTARAIAQVLWEEDVQSWWTWRGAGPAFHPTRKVELRLPSGHDRKVAKAAKEFNKSFERDAFGLDESPTDHLDDFLALRLTMTLLPGPLRDYLNQYSDDRQKQREEIDRLLALMAGYLVVTT